MSTASAGAERSGTTREVVAEQRERFGGMKFGACFFGWLTATGTIVLLTALLTAVGAGVGLGREIPADPAAAPVDKIGVVGAIVVLVTIFVGYLAGGYVAGRMARFNGAKQGFGVWLWAIVAAVVIAIVSLLVGAQYNFGTVSGLPRMPIDRGYLSVVGIITAVLVVVVALVGAVLGGLSGMRFHRRIDRATHEPSH